MRGDNLPNVVQYMEREHGDRFAKILTEIARKIPGLKKSDTAKSEDGFLLLRFYADGFDKPFFVQQMSDGTLKIFTYLLLLEDPEPAPFICIEEPENGLYHKLLPDLAAEFRSHATEKRTHRSYSLRPINRFSSTRYLQRKHGFWRRETTASRLNELATIPL